MNSQLLRKVLWAIPLCTFAADASAWGLFTHLYFAQYITFALPVFDPKIQHAIKRFPQLVLAGACLPDLALISKDFNTTHQWHTAEALLNQATSEEETALAIGYLSHLYVDILAHNHFVPAFEAKWLNNTIWTHVVSEWAMDAHIATHIQHPPYKLIKHHLHIISPLIAKSFNISHGKAKRSLINLAWADKMLRMSKIASCLFYVIARRDDEFIPKLAYYLKQTEHALHEFEALFKGKTPTLQAELTHLSATEMVAWRVKCLMDVRLRLSTLLHVHEKQSSNTPLLP